MARCGENNKRNGVTGRPYSADKSFLLHCAKSETWDFNLVDDEGLSVTFDKIRFTGADTVTLKDVNGKITAEIE